MNSINTKTELKVYKFNMFMAWLFLKLGMRKYSFVQNITIYKVIINEDNHVFKFKDCEI